MAELAIRTEHLSRNFGAVQAVNDLSLEVPAGMVFGFLGANGAGKTTTIHLLLGLLEPTGGQATVLGFNSHTRADQIRARTGPLLDIVLLAFTMARFQRAKLILSELADQAQLAQRGTATLQAACCI